MLSLKVSLHISHLSTALKLLLTYSSTPPVPCPSGFWFSRSFLNNLYPSKASSLSAIFGFVHDSVIPIMSGAHFSLFIYNSNSAFFAYLQYFLHLHTYILRAYCLWFPYAFVLPYHSIPFF